MCPATANLVRQSCPLISTHEAGVVAGISPEDTPMARVWREAAGALPGLPEERQFTVYSRIAPSAQAHP